jgi:hypothetical protein
MSGEPARQAGHSLAEAVTALTVGGLIATVLAAALAAGRAAATAQGEAIERAEARRIAAVVLAAEVRALSRDDFRAPAPDLLELRAMRGAGVVCDRSGDALLVRYRGLREPDPAKDSAVVVSGGGESVHDIEESAQTSSACTSRPGERVLRWRLQPAPPQDAAVLLLFERGSYHLSDAALRYRRGQAGRQPITPTVLRTPPSAFRQGAGFLAVLLAEAGAGAAPPRELRIRLQNDSSRAGP